MHPRDLLDLLVPPVCLACRAPGADLCAACRLALPWLPPGRCARCGLPRPCGRPCPAAGHAYATAWAPWAHAGPARTLVTGLKFRRATAAAGLVAAAMADHAPPALLDGATLVPVPAHPGRRRARGLDHALLLARALTRHAGLPLAPRVLRHAGGPGVRQLGTGRAERLAAGARMAVRAPGPVPAGRLVLVDDVHTTGATLHACATALRAAGATDVAAITAVRALSH